MQAVVNQEGAASVIKPVGPMVSGELEELENKLQSLLQNWTKRIIINMNDVPLIDSAGLELMMHYQLQLGNHGLKMKLSGLTEMVQRIFDLTKLSGNFEIFPDTASAVRSYL